MNDFKNRPKSEMPREKLLHGGAGSLSDAELLALLLQTGTRGKDVFALAVELLNRCGGMAGIEKTGIDELLMVEGLSIAKAATIKAAVETGRRVIHANRAAMERISNSKDAFDLLQPLLGGQSKEIFMVILLDSRNHVLGIKRIGDGTVNAALIYPRELMELAIRASATGLILAHNHPSGGTVPSIEDKRLTLNILVLGELSNMALHDHIIVGHDGYFSFADQGLLASMRQQFLRALSV